MPNQILVSNRSHCVTVHCRIKLESPGRLRLLRVSETVISTFSQKCYHYFFYCFYFLTSSFTKLLNKVKHHLVLVHHSLHTGLVFPRSVLQRRGIWTINSLVSVCIIFILTRPVPVSRCFEHNGSIHWQLDSHASDHGYY